MKEVINIDGTRCEVRRTDRVTLGISVERDGSVVINAPKNVGTEVIERYISGKRLWIHQKLAYKKETNKEKIQRDFVNGQGFLYLGKSYRLRLLRDGIDDSAIKKIKSAIPLRFHNGYFELPEREQSRARDYFLGWYKKKTEEQLKARIPRYDKRIGVEVNNLRVLDLKNRWASYSAKGTLNFSWRSVLAPIWVFDYILVHELAHMIKKGHSKEFWDIVARVIPDYQEHEAWLQEHGAELNI